MSAREKILEAADALFGRVGFDAATTREIAELSGVNKALIHYHFKNKEALLGNVLDRYYGKLARTIQAEFSGEGSLRERMERLIDVYMDFLDKNRNFSRIVQREASGGKHVDRIRSHMAPLFRLGMETVQAAYPGTRSGDLAAAQLLISFYGMVISYFTYSDVLSHLWKTDPLSKRNLDARKEHLRRMLDIVMKSIEQDGQKAAGGGADRT